MPLDVRAVFALVLVVGCDGIAVEASERVEAHLRDGLLITFDPGQPVTEISDGDRFAWELPDGARVLLQTTARDEEPGSVERTPESVAVALAERYELGDAEGELSHHGCRAGSSDGECVSGWQIDDDGRRWTRRGVLFAGGRDIVWLDVVTPEGSSEGFESLATAVRESIRVEDR